jgi:hypothetical protein
VLLEDSSSGEDVVYQSVNVVSGADSSKESDKSAEPFCWFLNRTEEGASGFPVESGNNLSGKNLKDVKKIKPLAGAALAPSV